MNVSSFAAKVAPPREAVYAATKAALSAFTEGLWLDLAGSNIHAALVVPGAIDTEIWGKQEEPARYAGPKGNLQFPLDESMPLALIERIVKLRVKQDAAKAAAKRSKKPRAARKPRATRR